MLATRARRAKTLDLNIKNETSGGINPNGIPTSNPTTPAASVEPPDEPMMKPRMPPMIVARIVETIAVRVAIQNGFQYSSAIAYPSEAKKAKKKCNKPITTRLVLALIESF
jgi:hypothetical protein